MIAGYEIITSYWRMLSCIQEKTLVGPTILVSSPIISPLQWRHNEIDGVSNHQRLACLLRRRSKKTSNLRITGLCEGNSPVTGEFPAQRTSDVENVSIWWRLHDITSSLLHSDLQSSMDAVHLAGVKVSNDFAFSGDSWVDGDIRYETFARPQHSPSMKHIWM